MVSFLILIFLETVMRELCSYSLFWFGNLVPMYSLLSRM